LPVDAACACRRAPSALRTFEMPAWLRPAPEFCNERGNQRSSSRSRTSASHSGGGAAQYLHALLAAQHFDRPPRAGSWPVHLQSDRQAHGGSLEVISAPETGTTFAAPAADPRRDEASALAAAVALVAPRGALVRFAYLYAIDSGPDAADLPNMLVTFWFRYAQQAALLTIVAEFYLAAMHARGPLDRGTRADADRGLPESAGHHHGTPAGLRDRRAKGTARSICRR